MGLFNFLGFNKSKVISEETEAFEKAKFLNKDKTKNRRGEGIEDLEYVRGIGAGAYSVSSFNMFYDNQLNKQFASEALKIQEYRKMAMMTEIREVIDSARDESVMEDSSGNIISLNIKDNDILENENVVAILNKEFNDLFYNRINITEYLYDVLETYYVDGRVYSERVIDTKKPQNGIIAIKKLPTETMDYKYDPRTGKIRAFYQHLSTNPQNPKSIEEAKKLQEEGKLILFYPQQISFINYGRHGTTKREIFGYLESAKIPYNQLKLLEVSVIIYRLIRAPERLVFNVDVGNMPVEKAEAYVEKVKQSLIKKPSYDPSTGALSAEPQVWSILENFFLPKCLKLNTKIDLLNGESKELSEIINDYNNGIENEVYSVDQKSGKIIRGKIEWAGITRKNAEFVRVWLDNGEYVDCTPDHKFVMRNGTEVEAQDLKENDSLMPLYKKREKINKNSNEYQQVFDLKTNSWKFVHRLLGPKQIKGNAIHHKDFNRFNNNENNLISLLIKEHIKLHYNSNKERNSYIPLLEALNKLENRNKQRKALKDRYENKEFVEYWEKINNNKLTATNRSTKGSLYKACNFIGFNNYTKLKKNITINHKVVKVEKLDIIEDAGCLTIKDSGKNHNFGLSCGVFVKNSSDGRGSSIESVGGNPSGFSELDDIYYFARKLYRALKYPLSRVEAREEKQSGTLIFGGSSVGEITRDEVKWSQFLEKQQQKFIDDLVDVFLIHLDFKGIREKYGLNKQKIHIKMNAPNLYTEQLEQKFLETRFQNYDTLSSHDEFSKVYLMKRFLDMTDEEIQENSKSMLKDIEYGFRSADSLMGNIQKEAEKAGSEPEQEESESGDPFGGEEEGENVPNEPEESESPGGEREETENI